MANSKVYAKLGNGTVRDLTLDTDTRVSVINNLTSTSTTAALSANQGRLLNQSVSNGKNQVANAITDKGVAASGSDSFATLASKIGQIKSGGITMSKSIEYRIPDEAAVVGYRFKIPYTLNDGTLSGYTFRNTSFINGSSGLYLRASDDYYCSFDLVTVPVRLYLWPLSNWENMVINMRYDTHHSTFIWNVFTGDVETTYSGGDIGNYSFSLILP